MATTTNYGWVTPDDTALVKDGAAAIRTLGSSADTTTKALNPETTLGDLAYQSSTANVKNRLGLGTAGQVLQVNSGANAPEWATFSAGSMTLLATTTLTGASVTVSAIDQTYKNLYIVVENFLPGNDNRLLNIRVNGNSSDYVVFAANDVDVTANQDSMAIGSNCDNTVATKNLNVATIYNYASTTTGKFLNATAVQHNATTTTNFNFTINNVYFNSTGAITSILYRSSLGNMTSGTAYLYGVK